MKKLQTYMSTQKLTQTDFAQQVGTTQATISRWLDGQIPSVRMIRRVFEVTNGKVKPADWYVEPVPHSAGVAERQGAGA